MAVLIITAIKPRNLKIDKAILKKKSGDISDWSTLDLVLGGQWVMVHNDHWMSKKVILNSFQQKNFLCLILVRFFVLLDPYQKSKGNKRLVHSKIWMKGPYVQTTGLFLSNLMWKLSRTLSKLAIRYKKKWLTYFHYWINCRWLLHTLEWTCKNVDLRQSIVSFPHNVFGWINIKVIGEVITSLFYLLIWIWEGGCWKKFDSEQAKVILVNGEYEFCAIFVEDLSIKNVLTALKNNW